MPVLYVFLLSSAIMVLAWWYAIRINNFSIVDIFWAGLFTPASIFLYFYYEPNFRHLFFTMMVSAWSMRLSSHLLFRIAQHHPQEDGRYVAIRNSKKEKLNSFMFWFFQAQAGLVVFLATPIFFTMADPEVELNPIHALAAFVWLLSLWGETLADKQLRDFKARPDSKGRACRQGLWRYSRHPNYFFEWLIWISFALFATGSPGGWVSFCSPALMLYFLLKITGIPATEEQSLRTKGEDYRQYQRETSMFVPWFPKKKI